MRGPGGAGNGSRAKLLLSWSSSTAFADGFREQKHCEVGIHVEGTRAWRDVFSWKLKEIGILLPARGRVRATASDRDKRRPTDREPARVEKWLLTVSNRFRSYCTTS